jgi:hypothetical protein
MATRILCLRLMCLHPLGRKILSRRPTALFRPRADALLRHRLDHPLNPTLWMHRQGVFRPSRRCCTARAWIGAA